MSDMIATARPCRTYPQGSIGVPVVDGVMSTALWPSSDTEPSRATEFVVISGRFFAFTWNTTSTRSFTNCTSVTVPTSTPAIRTGEPDASPATLVNLAFSGYRCQANPLVPVRLKMRKAVIVTPTIVSTPIFSSDHASERVRGIFQFYERNVRI